jgi:hypothetical protein
VLGDTVVADDVLLKKIMIVVELMLVRGFALIHFIK